jgi:hypothetical protein
MSRTTPTMPPDAGATNSGVAPTIGQCGRGNPRIYDARHIGDNVPRSASAKAQTQTLTPGTNAETLLVPYGDIQAGPPGASTTPFGFDSQSAPQTGSGAYAGFDGSGEGFDGYSGKQGQRN